MNTNWKIIEEAPRYEVSSEGEVRNTITGRILKASTMPNGYLKVSLVIEKGKQKGFYTHRLVAKAFVANPNPEEFTQVNHKDECKTNNHWSNLEWCSHKYNINYGTGPARRKATVRNLLENCEYGCGTIVYAYDANTKEFLGKYGSQREAARQLNCDQSGINRAMNKNHPNKTCKGMIFFNEPQDFDIN